MRAIIFLVLIFAIVINAAETKVKVAIVGGGAAGIGAAEYLFQSGMNDFVVLEARDRVGGRVQSVEFHGYTVDLGAAWFQGTNGSYLWKLKEKYDMPCSYTDFADMYMFYPNGSLIEQDVVDEYLTLADEMYAASEVIAEEMIANHSQDISLLTIVKDKIGFIQDSMEEDDYALRMWMLWYYFVWAYGDELKDVGFRSMFNEVDPKSVFTPADCLNREGFQTLFVKMAAQFNDKVRLSTPVSAIDYSNSLTRITLSNGDVVIADKVIVTVPDAVLASGDISFTPSLPPMYPLLWSFAGRAQYLKIFLHFPTYFWEELGDREFWAYTYADVEGYYPSFQNLNFPDYFPGSNILVATVTGNEGRRLSALSDSQVQAEIVGVIRKMFPAAPEPDGIMTNKWYQEEYSKSVWSGTTVNSFPSVRLAYRMPIDEKIYFAGEWTADEFNGYVHGALYTGRDQAEVIIKCINQTQSLQPSSSSESQNCHTGTASSSLSSFVSLLVCFVVLLGAMI